jgi:hypothetical protein
MQRIPYRLLLPLALLLALAPFGQPPHLTEKVGMLIAGTLQRPIDIFDLLLHSAPLGLLLAKVVADLKARRVRRDGA